MTYSLVELPGVIVRDEDGRMYRGRLTYIRGLSLDDHFTLLFNASSIDEHGCRIWIGSKTTERYGRLVKKGKRYLASRLAYERFKGPLPEGLEACHSCDNPLCVEPDHLFAGTTKDNALDRQAKGRGNHESKRIAFRVRDPSGKPVDGYFLTKFCVEHGLLQPKMSEVLRGSRPHHKGWTRYG